MPFQCSISGWLSALASSNWPTAQPSVPLTADTPVKRLLVTRCCCGFSLGTTCQTLPAAAAPAPPAAVTASRHAAAPRPSILRITCVSSVAAPRARRPGQPWNGDDHDGFTGRRGRLAVCLPRADPGPVSRR